jgi:hypothetical protein
VTSGKVCFVLAALCAITLRTPFAQAKDYKFGAVPLQDVRAAATARYETLDHENCDLSVEKLVAYMLVPTRWEVEGGATTESPSPMTLSRADNKPALYPPGHSAPGSRFRRAFWHPGIGAWQLDDSGLGNRMSYEKFNTLDAATKIAETIAKAYCEDPDPLNVFRRWYGCADDRTTYRDRDRCQRTFVDIYNGGSPLRYTEDPGTGRYGGSELRTCRLRGQAATFVCYYVDPRRAEGYKGSWTGNPEGLTVGGRVQTPLSKPFYVYKRKAGNVVYEWRYWMAADTGFGNDLAKYRKHPENSRDAQGWVVKAESTVDALCDTTQGRGACDTATPPAPPTGLGASPLSSSSIRFVWTDNSTNEAQFYVYRWNGTAWVWIGAVAANVKSYTDSGLLAATTYYYTVCAVNSAGSACANSHATVKTSPATATMNWTIEDGCQDGRGFRVRFFDKTRGGVFPSGGSYFVVSSGGTSIFSINAPAGSQLCLGAQTEPPTSNYWCYGINGNQNANYPTAGTAVCCRTVPAGGVVNTSNKLTCGN